MPGGGLITKMKWTRPLLFLVAGMAAWTMGYFLLNAVWAVAGWSEGRELRWWALAMVPVGLWATWRVLRREGR